MATLTIASKNYGSWSLRGWLLCKMAGLDFEEQQARSDDPSTRAELHSAVAVVSRPLLDS
jgi:glutathione S-transferase